MLIGNSCRDALHRVHPICAIRRGGRGEARPYIGRILQGGRDESHPYIGRIVLWLSINIAMMISILRRFSPCCSRCINVRRLPIQQERDLLAAILHSAFATARNAGRGRRNARHMAEDERIARLDDALELPCAEANLETLGLTRDATIQYVGLCFLQFGVATYRQQRMISLHLPAMIGLWQFSLDRAGL